MEALTITRQETPSGGRYAARLAGFKDEAELAYARVSPRLVSADHTLTPHAMRGKGVASALVERLVADARSDGFRIIPRCPFVKDQFERHPEWSELRGDSHLERHG